MTQPAPSSSSESSEEEEDAPSQVWYFIRLDPLGSCNWLLTRAERLADRVLGGFASREVGVPQCSGESEQDHLVEAERQNLLNLECFSR